VALDAEHFYKLLAALDPDLDRAAEKYTAIQSHLIEYFIRECFSSEAGELADKTINRVTQKIGSSLFQLDSFFVSVPGLCGNLKDRKDGSSLFQVEDFLDAASLCSALKDEGNLLSHYLRDQFGPATWQLLNQYIPEKKPSPELLGALVVELNKVLQVPLLYDQERFKAVQLSEQTQSLIKEYPSGKGLVRLNRMLLEDAYPRNIRKDAVSDYLLSQFAPNTLQLLEQYTPPKPTINPINALVDELKTLLSGPPLYEQARFVHVQLREETKALLTQKLQDVDRLRLNRMLIEDAYPKYMVKSLGAYANGVARKILLEEKRRRRKEVGEEELEKWRKEKSEEEDEGMKERAAKCLRQCLSKLSRSRPKLFTGQNRRLLRYFYKAEGLGKEQKRKQLADSHGLTLGNMRNRLYNMRKELRPCIEKCLDRSD